MDFLYVPAINHLLWTKYAVRNPAAAFIRMNQTVYDTSKAASLPNVRRGGLRALLAAPRPAVARRQRRRRRRELVPFGNFATLQKKEVSQRKKDGFGGVMSIDCWMLSRMGGRIDLRVVFI